MKEKTKSYVDQNGKILKHFCYFFFSTLKETFPVHRYLYKHCNKSANTSGSWCNRNPTKNTHVLTSSKRSLSSHRERPCRSFLMLTQSRVSVAPILGRRRLKEGGGGGDRHTRYNDELSMHDYWELTRTRTRQPTTQSMGIPYVTKIQHCVYRLCTVTWSAP